jgi:hypothetical protein
MWLGNIMNKFGGVGRGEGYGTFESIPLKSGHRN